MKSKKIKLVDVRPGYRRYAKLSNYTHGVRRMPGWLIEGQRSAYVIISWRRDQRYSVSIAVGPMFVWEEGGYRTRRAAENAAQSVVENWLRCTATACRLALGEKVEELV